VCVFLGVCVWVGGWLCGWVGGWLWVGVRVCVCACVCVCVSIHPRALPSSTPTHSDPSHPRAVQTNPETSAIEFKQGACKHLEEAGVRFQKRPQDGSMRGLAFALDPDGCVCACVGGWVGECVALGVLWSGAISHISHARTHVRTLTHTNTTQVLGAAGGPWADHLGRTLRASSVRRRRHYSSGGWGGCFFGSIGRPGRWTRLAAGSHTERGAVLPLCCFIALITEACAMLQCDALEVDTTCRSWAVSCASPRFGAGRLRV
jgi:hypothetical protein